MFNESLFSRRLFLSRGVQLLSVASTLPMFLDRSARCMAADFADNPHGAGRPDGRVLVVVQLAGGNDGLNTVVPIGNDDYYRARPKLAIAKDRALKLTSEWGLHPAASGFKKLYDAGDLAVLHAVGYPNPNRSHFRSTDIWTTGQPDKLGSTGWLGRYCDACCKGDDPDPAKAAMASDKSKSNKTPDPAAAIALDSEAPPALQGEKFLPLTFRAPERMSFGRGKGQDAFDKLNAPEMSEDVGAMQAPEEHGGEEMHGPAMKSSAGNSTEEFLQRSALNARIYADRIRNISSTVENKAVYPQSPFAKDLKLVAQLIAAGLPTRVYYVKLGGFDTHADQLQRHPRLLQDLTGGIAAFIDDLKQLGHLDRTTLMTFSEFGRRVHENGSGTDHGEAAPLFLAGGAVKAGLHGRFPSLAADQLHRGDIPFTTDFRRVYATILDQWMGANSSKILGGRFEHLDLLKKA